MKPLYLLSEVISLSCQFVGTVDSLLCQSLYFAMSLFPTGAQVSTSTDQKHTYSKDVDMCTNESEKGLGKREPSE